MSIYFEVKHSPNFVHFSVRIISLEFLDNFLSTNALSERNIDWNIYFVSRS